VECCSKLGAAGCSTPSAGADRARWRASGLLRVPWAANRIPDDSRHVGCFSFQVMPERLRSSRAPAGPANVHGVPMREDEHQAGVHGSNARADRPSNARAWAARRSLPSLRRAAPGRVCRAAVPVNLVSTPCASPHRPSRPRSSASERGRPAEHRAGHAWRQVTAAHVEHSPPRIVSAANWPNERATAHSALLGQHRLTLSASGGHLRASLRDEVARLLLQLR